MNITPATLSTISGKPVNDNMKSVIKGLMMESSCLRNAWEFVPFIGQTCHESMGWTYDREIWGPTPAQVKYDTRTDLGNSPKVDGDGYLYRGRTGIQITGKANTTSYWNWCKSRFSDVPDFVSDPDKMNTDPWEGLGPIWYWHTHTYLGRYLSQWASDGSNEAITRCINGGLNGYKERVSCTLKAGLLLLGSGIGSGAVRLFQTNAGLLPTDGIAGPNTWRAIYSELKKLQPLTFSL